MRKLVIVLRHGERADRVVCRKYKVPFDPCLTQNGLNQAEIATNKILEALSPNMKVHLVSSPFLRCLETAGKVALKLNTPIHVEEGFGEFLQQEFSSETMDNLYFSKHKQKISREIGVELVENQHVIRAMYPESFSQASERVQIVWERYLKQCAEYDVIIVVTHLFIVDELVQIWFNGLDLAYNDGYCKLAIAELSNKYTPVFFPSSAYLNEF